MSLSNTFIVMEAESLNHIGNGIGVMQKRIWHGDSFSQTIDNYIIQLRHYLSIVLEGTYLR